MSLFFLGIVKMTIAISNLPLDKSGRYPDNLVVIEKQNIDTSGRLGLVTLTHGGFYSKDITLFDSSEKRLAKGLDYITTYSHRLASEYTGLNIDSLIVILNPDVVDHVYVTAQMVGGDLAYTFTAKEDYLAHLDTQEPDYVPYDQDFVGNEVIYEPGELKILRWRLDTFQPLNNKVYELSRTIAGMLGEQENAFRDYVDEKVGSFIGGIDDGIGKHIGDMDNPHETTAAHLGFNVINNYPLATDEEAELGEANDKYLTPASMWLTITPEGFDYIYNHVDRTDNPHKLTREQLQIPPDAYSSDLANTKYFTDDEVANTYRMPFNGLWQTYSAMVNEFKKNIPADNFTRGKVSLQRMAPGSTAYDSVLMSSPYQWTHFDGVVREHMLPYTAQIYRANYAITRGKTREQIHAAISREFRNSPVYMTVMYRCSEAWYWLDGATVPSGFQWFTHASHRASDGSWVQAHPGYNRNRLK